MLYLLKEWEQKSQGELARKVLAFGLRQEYGIRELPRIERRKEGKPYFPEFPDIFFNYSHSRQGIFCGIHTSELGVDIERIIPYRERLAKRLCHPKELELLDKSKRRDEMMTRIWTCKESYLKYTGSGIRRDLRLLDCSDCALGNFELDGTRIVSGMEETYGFAVCCKEKLGDLIEIDRGALG